MREVTYTILKDGFIMNKETKFSQMDIGSTQPTAKSMDVVEVVVSSDGLLGDYARAFVREASRVNPDLAKQVKLTEDELVQYADYLLTMRIQSVNGTCNDFRRLKALYVPSFLQYVLSMIGIVIDRSYGLKLIPVMDKGSKMTLTQALCISEKIGSFENDLQIVLDAMPRDVFGDKNVMSTALIAGYVMSYQKVDHPAATYVTAILKMKLRQETSFTALYRIRYDDVDFIAAALLTQKGLF